MTLAANARTSFPPATAQRGQSPRPRRAASANTFGISLVTLAGLISLWFLAARFDWASPLFLP
ncbi:MAG: taurine transporter subunit, partial [Mesorhizobium sp.]